MARSQVTSLLLALLPLACQATGGARLSAGVSLRASASGSASAGATGVVGGRVSVKIRFIKGAAGEKDKLDYQGTINFAYDQARLEGEETSQVLGDLRDFLRDNPKVKVQIEGHTDSRGTPTYNKSLSARRAAAIQRWLVEHGIDEQRMTSTGFGEEKSEQHEVKTCFNLLPKDTSACEEGWAASRRAVFTVTEGAETIGGDPPPAPRAQPTASEWPPPPPDAPGLHRVGLLGVHVGVAQPNFEDYRWGVAPLGLDAGLWPSERLALGLSLETAPGPFTRARGELWTEVHSSAGPGASLWGGLAVGGERIAGPTGPHGALRLGVDIFAARDVRIGPYLEVSAALRDGSVHHGWLGLNLRLAFDFLRPR